MRTMRQENIFIADTMEYAFAKMSPKQFSVLSDVEKNAHRKKLAELRIKQIKRNPEVYPDGITGNLVSLARK